MSLATGTLISVKTSDTSWDIFISQRSVKCDLVTRCGVKNEPIPTDARGRGTGHRGSVVLGAASGGHCR